VQAATEGLKVPDLEVLDQDGQPQHFYTDLVSGKVVAINFVFTTCTTVCPPMGATFSRLQRLLAEAGREDVALISVSIDPAVDTPARMKAWGRNFKAGDHWTLVTGAKPQIDRLLKGLGVFTADKSEHSPITILGNDRTGQWKRTNGLASPQKMVRQLMAMSEEPSAAPAADSVAGQ
jgi:cytochrome oxidase Cu insertion factor (SCO1/SenC/PrrC family)